MSESGFSRRSFLKGISTTAVVGAAARVSEAATELAKASGEKEQGPGAVPLTLKINGKTERFTLEPRVTLLEVLRQHTSNTGAKEVCDRGTCGACTVLLDGVPVYSCMTLAITAQMHEITTVEGLAKDGKLTPVQQSFVECDALMCGYCTPGFVMSVTALLKRNPKPTEADVKHACSGNLCRCGTYPRVFEAALKAAGVAKAGGKTS
jgi:aerobic-type carbon monoxide dehydrogenase small subunit (CoxS/CutS family)